MGEGMACGGLPFLGTGCPILDVDNLCLLCIDFYVSDAVSIFNHIPRMFLSTDFAFRITDWTCCHGPHLHAILRIIIRGVSGLGPWIYHLPPAWYSTFWLTFQNESLEWYFIYLLFLAWVHGFMHETSDFLLYNNLLIYQVLCALIYRRRSLYYFLLPIIPEKLDTENIIHDVTPWR